MPWWRAHHQSIKGQSCSVLLFGSDTAAQFVVKQPPRIANEGQEKNSFFMHAQQRVSAGGRQSIATKDDARQCRGHSFSIHERSRLNCENRSRTFDTSSVDPEWRPCGAARPHHRLTQFERTLDQRQISKKIQNLDLFSPAL
jgi:hypothetical protein